VKVLQGLLTNMGQGEARTDGWIAGNLQFVDFVKIWYLSEK